MSPELLVLTDLIWCRRPAGSAGVGSLVRVRDIFLRTRVSSQCRNTVRLAVLCRQASQQICTQHDTRDTGKPFDFKK